MTKSIPRWHRRFGLASAMILALGLATACTESGNDSPTGISSEEAAEIFGESNPAEGAVVKIGYVETGQTPAVDTTDEDKTAVAVAKYANEYLGGLAGHKIEVVVCETKGTPSGAQECGSTFVREGVVAVASSSPGEPEGTIEQLNAGGIAMTANLMANQTALAAPDTFIFGNPLAVFGTPAKYGKDNGLERAALVVIDVPGSAGAATTIAPLIFGNAGMQADPVLVPPGTADMTPQIQAELKNKPDMWFVLGEPTFCSTAAKGFQTLSVTENVLVDSRCVGADAAAAMPGLDNMLVGSSYTTDESDPDWPLFTAVLSTYAEDVEVGGDSITAFQGMLSLIRVVNQAAPAEVTAVSVIEALKSAEPVPYPLGGGIEVQCNASMALSANVCSTGGLLAEATAAGGLENFVELDASELYAPPAK